MLVTKELLFGPIYRPMYAFSFIFSLAEEKKRTVCQIWVLTDVEELTRLWFCHRFKKIERPLLSYQKQDLNQIIEMASAEKSAQWRSVFDGVKLKTIKAMPEALMVEINAAICNLEYARVTALLDSASSSSSSSPVTKSEPEFNAQVADQAYKAGCAALAAGKLDELLSL